MRKSSIVIRSAGRTRAGRAGRENSDYFCCVDFPLGEAIRGVYGVADGSLSASDGPRASEMSVEILKDKVRQTRQNAEEPFMDTLFERAFTDVHSELRSRRGEDGTATLATSITCGCLVRDTFYFAHAGSGAAYLVESGGVRRLTQDQRPPSGEEVPSALRKKFLGMDDTFQADYFSHRIAQSATVLFCADGLTNRVENIALMETALQADTPDQIAERLIELAASRGETDDITIVVVSITVKDTEAPRYVPGIRYPLSAMLTKYSSVGALLLSLALVYRFHGVYIAIRAEGGAPAAAFVKTGPAPGPGQAATPEEDLSLLTFESTPSGARVYVNDIYQGADTPAPLRLPSGEIYRVRLELDGYRTYETEVRLESGVDDYRKVTLRKETAATQGQSATLVVSCGDGCDEVKLDGRKVSGGEQGDLTLGSVPAGRHTLTATRDNVTRTRVLTLLSGGKQRVAFRFPESRVVVAAPIPTPEPEPEPAAQRPEPKKPDFQRATPKTQTAPTLAVRRPALNPAPKRDAFLLVKSDEPGCSVMVFQDGGLVRTGFTGDRMSLPPGSYKVQVSKDGFEPVIRDVNLRGELQVLDIRIR